MYVYVCLCIHTYIYTYIHAYIHTYLCTYIHIYTYTHTHTHTHTHTGKQTVNCVCFSPSGDQILSGSYDKVCVCVCVCVSVCVCVCECIAYKKYFCKKTCNFIYIYKVSCATLDVAVSAYK
jgi:WD40 repeat protein